MKASSLIGHAAEVLFRIRSSRYPPDAEIAQFFRGRRYLGSHDRKTISETVYGVLRHRRRLDDMLASSEGVLDGVTDEGTDLLRVAAYLLGLQRPSSFAPPDFRPLLDDGQGESRFLSALERLAGQPWPEPGDPGVRFSFPSWMVDTLSEEYGRDDAVALLASLNEPAPLSIRVNTLKTNVADCRARLALDRISASPGRYGRSSLVLARRMNAFTLDAFRDGWFEVQDEGSQLLAELLDPRPTDRVLDLCAGAGGKTLALSAIMKNRGEIIATDVSARRLDELRKRSRRAGAGNIRIRDSVDRSDEFDIVFVDAPCTGVGTIRRNPGMKWSVTPEMVAEMSAKQADILARAAQHVRPGGLLAYATCSLFRAENEVVVERFVASNSAFSLEDMSDRLHRAGLGDASRGRSALLLPHRHGTDGFFCAFLRRT